MTENPITKIRQELNLSVQQFARFLGVSLTESYAVGKGLIKNPKTVIKAMENNNIIGDKEELIKAYSAWREENEKREREKLIEYVEKRANQ
jgi:hypothetical protein